MELDDNYLSPFIKNFTLYDGGIAYLWHSQIDKKSASPTIDLVNSAVSNGYLKIEVNPKSIHPYLRYFRLAFNIGGISTINSRLNLVIIQKQVWDDFNNLLKKYNLQEYADLFLFVASHIQVLQIEANSYLNDLTIKEEAKSEKSEVKKILELIENYIVEGGNKSAHEAIMLIRFVMADQENSVTIKNQLFVYLLMNSFIKEYIGWNKDFSLPNNWKEMLASYFTTKRWVKDYQHAMPNIAKAIAAFLVNEHIVRTDADPTPNKLIAPIADFLELVNIDPDLNIDTANVRNWITRDFANRN